LDGCLSYFLKLKQNMRKTSLLLICFFVTSSLHSQVIVAPILDTQRVAILPFDYTNDGNHISIADIEYGFFNSTNSIKAFF